MTWKKWSQWALGNYQKCGYYFYLKHIKNIRKQKSMAAIRGIAVHQQAQDSFQSKMDGLGLYSVERAQDVASDTFDGIFSQEHRIDKEELEALGSVEKVRAFYKDETMGITKHHVVAMTPPVNPIAIERKIVVKPQGFDFSVATVVDLVDCQPKPTFSTIAKGVPVGPADTQEVIRDLKTRRKAPFKDEAARSQQLTFQALGRYAETGKLPDEVGLDVVWQTPKMKKIDHRFDRSTRTEEDLNVLLRRVQQAGQATEKGVFTPAPPDSWFCSSKYCEYFRECPYGGAQRVQSK